MADIYSRFVLPEQIDDPLWLLKRDIAAQLRKLLPLTVTPEGDLAKFQQVK